MDAREDIGAPLDDTFACLWHCDGRTGGQKDWLVARGERQVAEIVALDEDHLLVAEAHLSSGVP